MKLELVNFRTFSRAVFSLCSNFTLISGPSGTGKTSILMAIQFAITGEGKKVVKHGHTKCSVILTMDSLKITRTKGPCRLIVEKGNTEYEDSEAQSVINSTLPNWSYGYLSQRLYKSFVLMTPVDKLLVIEKIAFAGFDIKTLQNKCKSLILSRKNELADLKKERITIEKVLNDLGYSEQTEDLIEDQSTLDDRLSRLVSERIELTNKISIVQNNKDLKKKLIREQSELQEQLKNYEEINFEKNYNIKDLIVQTNRYNKYKTEKDRLDESTCHSGMTEIEIENRISDLTFLKSVDSELLKLDKYRLELKELNEYKQTHVILIGNCPSCNTSISSCDGKLTLSDGKHFISEKEVSNIEKKISNLISSINYLEDLEINKKDILNVYKETEVDDKYLSYLKHVKVNDKIWNTCNTLICEKPVHDIDVIIRTTQEREAKIAMRNIINEKLSKVEDKLDNLDLEDNCIDVYLDKMRDINMDINTTTESIKNFEIRNQWEKVKKLRIAEQDMETKLPRAVKLSALITKAERIALDDTISNINLRTNIYLSRFLPNVIANIIFLSEKLDLKITIDEEPTDINSLSGGEFARVVLAFAIAMAEINNVPILILDESFASLDAETTESVLEAIRENYNGDIIVVAHQTTKGVFDTVIELKKLYMTK